MTLEVRKGELPPERMQGLAERLKVGLDDMIESVANVNNKEVIKKIREVCEPLIVELVSNRYRALRASTGIWDYMTQVTTNANVETEKLMEEKFQDLEEFWNANRQMFLERNFTEDDYWKCVEWVPTYHITDLYEARMI